MPSFFDKLKKGMNIESNSDELDESIFEEPKEETISASFKKQKPVAEKKQADSKTSSKAGKEKTEKKKKEFSFAVKQAKKTNKPEIAKEETSATGAAEGIAIQSETFLKPEEVSSAVGEKSPEAIKDAEKIVVQQKETWPEAEGELVVDVYQTESELVVQSAVAGVKPEELDIDIEKDILIIRGARENNAAEKRDYFFQECYWGPFSRQIILPVEVDAARVKAEMREGVLTIIMPKIVREGKKKISVQVV